MNIFDQTGVNEQGLRPNLKRAGTIEKKAPPKSIKSSNISVQRQQLLATKNSDSEEKKVDFIFDVEKLNQESFLKKLSDTVKKIGEKQSYIGQDQEARKMKMQGVLKASCKIDLYKHFTKPDFRAEER